MACENDKCEKYGLHHDYKDGVEVRKCVGCYRDVNGFYPPYWDTNKYPMETQEYIDWQQKIKQGLIGEEKDHSSL